MSNLEDVKTWVKAMGERGVYGDAAARIRSTAIEQLSSVLAKDEPKDPKWLLQHIKDVANRWATKNKANPATANTYRSRAKSTLEDYQRYHENPGAFRRNGGASNPAKARTGKGEASTKATSKKRSPTERAAGGAGDVVDVEHRSDDPEQLFSFSLSSGRAQLRVPATLSEGDISILRKQLEMLELQAQGEGRKK